MHESSNLEVSKISTFIKIVFCVFPLYIMHNCKKEEKQLKVHPLKKGDAPFLHMGMPN